MSFICLQHVTDQRHQGIQGMVNIVADHIRQAVDLQGDSLVIRLGFNVTDGECGACVEFTYHDLKQFQPAFYPLDARL